MAQLHNRPDKLAQRRTLRSAATPAEATLWRTLQNSQLDGRKFRRQHSIGPYIVDFYCPAEKLAVELDGAPHFTAGGSLADDGRTAFLEAQGVQIVRIENKQVFAAFEMALSVIRAAFRDAPAG